MAILLLSQGVEALRAQDAKHTPAEIQQALSRNGFDIGVIDGKWGPRSGRALEAFQKSVGLEASGTIDGPTLRKLFAASSPSASPKQRSQSTSEFNPTTIETISLYRLASTGIGDCRRNDLDLAKIDASLRVRLGDRYAVIAHTLLDIGNKEMSGVKFLDDSFREKSCESWSLTARFLGFQLERRIAHQPELVSATSAKTDRNVTPAIMIATVDQHPNAVAIPVSSYPSVKVEVPSARSGPGIIVFGTISTALLAFWALSRNIRRSRIHMAKGRGAVAANTANPPPLPPPSVKPKADTAYARKLAERKEAYDRHISETAQRIASPKQSPTRDEPTIVVVPLAVAPAVSATSDPNSPVKSAAVIAVSPPIAVLKHDIHVGDRLADLRSAAANSRINNAEILTNQVVADPGKPPSQPQHPPRSQNAVREVAAWIPGGIVVTVGARDIKGGMIYVGTYLPCSADASTNENCLIDPSLQIATRADLTGQYLSYQPAYGTLAPSSRKAYLDWLAGPRSDPSVHIGYVFLYFYGLERRLLIDPQQDGQAEIVAEVERLLAVYRESASFRRCGRRLLAAHRIKTHGIPSTFQLDLDDRSSSVPMELLAILGNRLQEGRPIGPDLMFSYVCSHPETHIGKPAQRALAVVKDLFVSEIEKSFPGGARVSNTEQLKTLEFVYRSASGTFSVDILPSNSSIPDISVLTEPLQTARRIFEECGNRVDAYSKELRRSAGLKPSFAAVAKLPVEIRWEHARKLDDDPLGFLETMVQSSSAITSEQFGKRLGWADPKQPNKIWLRELCEASSAFGIGITIDTAFTLRPPKADDPLVVFALEGMVDTISPPSDAFRQAQLAIVLATMVAMADGRLDEAEQQSLFEIARGAGGISADERRRLFAEIQSGIACGFVPGDVKSRVKAMNDNVRQGFGDTIIAMAGVDGSIAPEEVGLLEKLFRQMDLGTSQLYSKLHTAAQPPVDDIRYESAPPIILAAREATQTTFAPPSSPSVVKPPQDRQSEIRRETSKVSILLDSIFAEEAEEPTSERTAAPILPIEEPSGRFPGLTLRQQHLIDELVEKPSLPRSEFDGIARRFGLMPGAAIEVLNSWAFDRYDDPLLEGDDPIMLNIQLLSESQVSMPA